MRIACQGTLGAFSHLAAMTVFPTGTFSFYSTFQETLSAVRAHKADRAVVPIENSVAGRVMDIHNLLPNAHLYIVGEHFLRVEHHLEGLPSASLSDIKTVFSHPQALAQCARSLCALNITSKTAQNTAIAAETVAKTGDKTLGALASEEAATRFGLKILKRNLEDSSENTTRFLVLSTQQNPTPTGDNVMTSCVFFIKNAPAALYNALGAFARNGLNMTRLESYIDCKAQKTAGFFADIQADPTSDAYHTAFEELQKNTEKVAILGVYPACPARSSTDK